MSRRSGAQDARVLAAVLLATVAGMGGWPAEALAQALAQAGKTRLMEVDYRTGVKRRIDADRPRTAADRQLDALLDSSAGGASFTTEDLDRIEQALRRYLQSSRPRAMPTMLLFLYPGRISRGGLRELREVNVEIDLLVAPCGRTVCNDAIAQHIELLGRALRQPVLRASRYTLRFGSVALRTATAYDSTQFDVLRFSAEDVVSAAQRSGGGAALLGRLRQAEAGYERTITADLVKRMRSRRLALTSPPVIERAAGSVELSLEVRSDRVRYRDHALAGLLTAANALRANPLTPARGQLRLVAVIPFRTVQKRAFSCLLQPLNLHLDGRLDKGQLWDSYIVERGEGGQEMVFDDAEAAGRFGAAGGGGGEEAADRTNEILAAQMSLLAPCLQTEARRNPRFGGATLLFTISPAGKAEKVGLRERTASPALVRCLQQALGQIRFQRASTARPVEYPMHIRR